MFKGILYESNFKGSEMEYTEVELKQIHFHTRSVLMIINSLF